MIAGKITERIKNKPFLLYTILFAVTVFIASVWFIVCGKTYLVNTDGFNQYYSILVKLRHLAGDFLRGSGFSFWSWDIGLGSDTISNLAIVLLDPFSYIAAAFPVKYIDIGYSAACALKLYAAGAAMYAFLRSRDKSGTLCAFGALSYALSSWAFGSKVHIFFLSPLVLFPLIILGADKIRRKQSPAVFILSVAASCMTSFYFAYMSAIMAVAYIVVMYFTESQNKSFKTFLGYILKFFGCGITGIMISAPVLVPVLFGLFNSSTSSGTDVEILMDINNMAIYLPSIVSGGEVSGNYTYLCAGAVGAAMLPGMFILIKRKNSGKKLPVIMFFACMVMAFFPVFGSIFNGLSYSVGRWQYILAFFFVWSVCECLETNICTSPAYLKYSGFAIILFLISFIFAEVIGAFPSGFDVTALLNFIMAAVFIYAAGKRSLCFKPALFAAFNIGLVLFIQYSPFVTNELDKYLDAGQAYKQYSSSSLRSVGKIEDDDFYRVDQTDGITENGRSDFTHMPANEPIYYGARAMYTYLSTVDEGWAEFNNLLQNSTSYNRRVCNWGNDNRSRMNFLLGAEYFIGDDVKSDNKTSQYAFGAYKEYKTAKGVEIYKSKYRTSLGYVFDSAVDEQQFMQFSPLEREQLLMKNVCVDEPVSVPAPADLSADVNKVGYRFNGSSDSVVHDKKDNLLTVKDNGDLYINIDKAEDSELYVSFKNFRKLALDPKTERKLTKTEQSDNLLDLKDRIQDIYRDVDSGFEMYVKKDERSRRIIGTDGDNQGIPGVVDFTVNLGYFKSVSGNIDIYFPDTGVYTYDAVEVYAVPQNSYRKAAKKLSENRIKVDTLHDNYVKGSFQSDNGGVLYMSVLYTPGWQVYIDGERAETFEVNTAFTGVEVEAGAHTIEMKYRPPGFIISVCLSVTGITALIFMEIVKLIKRESNLAQRKE